MAVLLLFVGQLYITRNSLRNQLSRTAEEFGLVAWERLEPLTTTSYAEQVCYRSRALSTRQKERFVNEVEAILQSHGLKDLDTANGKRHAYARNRRWSVTAYGATTDVQLVCGAVETELWIEEFNKPTVFTLVSGWFRRVTGGP